MVRKLSYLLVMVSLIFSCHNENTEVDINPILSFEKINYYKYPVLSNDLPFQYRLTYHFDNTKPHRWIEIDSVGLVMTDYIYEYDSDWQQTGARYREESAIDFSVEQVSFKNDSTMVTQWVDSIGKVYYTMIDNLNKNKEDIWLVRKVNDKWSNKINLTETSGIHGGYFNWLSESEIYFQTLANKGDIVVGVLENNTLTIVENLNQLNTEDGTEFSPYIDERKRFIIFTRYVEDDESNQGFFISYNGNDYNNPKWSKPKKLNMLPYGWSANIINGGTQFIYSDGEDIYSVAIEELNLEVNKF